MIGDSGARPADLPPPNGFGRTSGEGRTWSRALVPHVIGWLQASPRADVAGTLAAWPAEAASGLRQWLTVHGLAPIVADRLAGTDMEALPPHARATATWLAGQLDQNRERMRRFAEDLSAILAAASATGVPVMPLKGSVLAFGGRHEPGLRPMADLDLLVRPADESALHSVLARLGYVVADAGVPRRRTFGRPGARVVAQDGTHPDNPRWVEVHAEIRRSVWLDRGGVDMAPCLWASAREDRHLGELAWLASDAALTAHVAAHATHHLLRGGGRLHQWLELAELANGVPDIEPGFDAWVYPALALAARAFPGERLAAHVARAAPGAGASLVRLAARVPLDDRAGLALPRPSVKAPGIWAERWRRWRPNPWLVRMSNPFVSVPWARGSYLLRVGTRGVTWMLQLRDRQR